MTRRSSSIRSCCPAEQAPSALLEAWKGEFDVLYAEDRMMMVGMHPEMIGQPSRIKALEGLIEHALSHAGVWIGRCDAMVDDMRPALERARESRS